MALVKREVGLPVIGGDPLASPELVHTIRRSSLQNMILSLYRPWIASAANSMTRHARLARSRPPYDCRQPRPSGLRPA
jgi:hypothetical protein